MRDRNGRSPAPGVECQYPPGGSFSFGGGYRDVRGCPGSYRRVHRCGSPGGGRFHGRSYCVAQYGGVCMVRTFSPGGRQYRGQRDGAPFQYRSLAACRRAQGCRNPRAAFRRGGAPDDRAPAGAARRSYPRCGGDAGFQYAGHAARSASGDRRGSPGRCGRGGGRMSGCRARRCGCESAGLRFLRLLRS